MDLWKEKDTNARLILMTTINSKEQQAFVNCRSANAIWTKLAAQHMQNASASTHVLQSLQRQHKQLQATNFLSLLICGKSCHCYRRHSPASRRPRPTYESVANHDKDCFDTTTKLSQFHDCLGQPGSNRKKPSYN